MRGRLRWSSLLALGGAVLAACALPAATQAGTYGQLDAFGKAGTGHEDEFKITPGTHAFGVDPTENSVYVGDELKAGEYRIQKLTASGAYVAQAVFKASNHDGIEGVAIDPSEQRVYVLALERRETTLAVASTKPAAATLYAFSTEPSGAELVPAKNEKGEPLPEGVLIGPSTLEPQSDAVAGALLNPKGIAVDPTTHDVIILGESYEGEVNKEPQLDVALQRVHSNGTLGERYIDSTGFFGAGVTPNSPVVSPEGTVYVVVQQPQVTPSEALQDELVQIPSDFASATPPTPFVQFALRGDFEEEDHPVVEFDSNEPTSFGGGLSFTPESPGSTGEGTIYARAHIFVGPREGPGGASYPGVLAFAGTTGSEVGWTGGQTEQSGSETPCAIGFGGETYPSVAGGGEHKVFMFDPGKSTRPKAPPRVVEFGPGGTGCPTAEASEPAATVNGQPLSPAEPVPAGTPVTFSSTMTQANALSVEWSFGDGATAIVGADEYQHTEVKHAFVRGGELTITETIHTDDLATPTIVKQTKISVSVVSAPPTAVLEGPSEVTLGGGGALGRLIYLEDGELGLEEAPQSEEATFDGSASYASTTTGPNRIVAYHWVFGDGESETTATATVKHKYKKADTYTAALTVTDALGSTSEPSILLVRVNEPPLKASISATGASSASPTEAPAATGDHSSTPVGAHSSTVIPDARLEGTTLTVSAVGTVDLDVTCPAGESSCAGTITLRTIGAVSAGASSHSSGAKKQRKTSVLTLAGGTFKVAGGREVSVRLHLSAPARTLLARAKTLHAMATIVAHSPTGASHTTQTLVTLHSSKPPGHTRRS
jgi:PKD repeat protein